MAKRQRIDSVNGALNAMEGASRDIQPPEWVNVPDEAVNFWRSITRARAADRWNDVDLENAAELARTKARIEKLNLEIEEEGDIIKNDKGTPIENPKHRLLETLTRRVVALSRMLQVHAEATQGKSRDQVESNKGAEKSRKAAQKTEQDNLLAGPMH